MASAARPRAGREPRPRNLDQPVHRPDRDQQRTPALQECSSNNAQKMRCTSPVASVHKAASHHRQQDMRGAPHQALRRDVAGWRHRDAHHRRRSCAGLPAPPPGCDRRSGSHLRSPIRSCLCARPFRPTGGTAPRRPAPRPRRNSAGCSRSGTQHHNPPVARSYLPRPAVRRWRSRPSKASRPTARPSSPTAASRFDVSRPPDGQQPPRRRRSRCPAPGRVRRAEAGPRRRAAPNRRTSLPPASIMTPRIAASSWACTAASCPASDCA